MQPYGLAGKISLTGYTPPPNMTFEQWEAEGQMLQRIDRALKWWIGDWINYGEHKYGEMYAQAVDATGWSPQVLMNVSSVCRKVETSLRNEILSWSHHVAIAKLPPGDQVMWLDRAEAEHLSVTGLRAAIKDTADSPPEADAPDGARAETDPVQAGRDFIRAIGAVISYSADFITTERNIDAAVTRLQRVFSWIKATPGLADSEIVSSAERIMLAYENAAPLDAPEVLPLEVPPTPPSLSPSPNPPLSPHVHEKNAREREWISTLKTLEAEKPLTDKGQVSLENWADGKGFSEQQLEHTADALAGKWPGSGKSKYRDVSRTFRAWMNMPEVSNGHTGERTGAVRRGREQPKQAGDDRLAAY